MCCAFANDRHLNHCNKLKNITNLTFPMLLSFTFFMAIGNCYFFSDDWQWKN